MAPKVVATTNVATKVAPKVATAPQKKTGAPTAPQKTTGAPTAPQKEAGAPVNVPQKVVATEAVARTNAQAHTNTEANILMMKELPYFDVITRDTPSIKVPESTVQIIKIQAIQKSLLNEIADLNKQKELHKSAMQTQYPGIYNEGFKVDTLTPEARSHLQPLLTKSLSLHNKGSKLSTKYSAIQAQLQKIELNANSPKNTTAINPKIPSNPTNLSNTANTNPATANTAIKPANTSTTNPATNATKLANLTLSNPANQASTLAQNTQTIKNATTLAKTKADALYQTYISHQRTEKEIAEHKHNLSAIAKKANGFSFLRDILDIHTGTIWKTFVPNAFIGDPNHVQKRIAYLENTILPNTQTEYNTLKTKYDSALTALKARLEPVSEQQTKASTINVNNKTLKLTQTEFDAQTSLLETQFDKDKQALISDANTQFDNYYNQTLAEEATNNAIANTATATATATAIATVNANAKLNQTNTTNILHAREPVYANLPSLSNTDQTDPNYANVPLKGGKRTILTKKQKHTIRNKCVRSHKSQHKKLRTRKTHMKRRTMLKKHKLN